MKSFFFLLIQIAFFNFFVDAGNITNQVVKTKEGHTCVLPTVVDKATSYLFLSNPQPGEIFEYCTLAHTSSGRNWPWCSYGKTFPEVENGVETFKWDYCTEYSWEYEGFRYTWKESTHVKSSYDDAIKFCSSQGGSLPEFQFTQEKEKFVEYKDRIFHFFWKYIEKTPVFEGELKTAVTEALRPLLAFYQKSSKRGFWMLTKPTLGTWTDVSRSTESNLVFGPFSPERCLTISPYGVATMGDCGKYEEDFADVLCQFKI